MIKYKFRNSYDMRIKRCNECTEYGTCQFHSYKLLTDSGACMHGKFKYKHPTVTNGNADWIIHIMKRDAQNAKTIANVIIRNHRMDWTKPESLKDRDLEQGPSVTECIGYRLALSQFLKVLREKSALPNVHKSNLIHSLIDTRFKVEHTIVYANVDNVDLVKYLKEELPKEGYQLKLVSKQEAC